MNNPKDNFLRLVERAMRTPDRAHMRPVIEKELLHYDILFCLDKAGILEKLTFQGGTSLRLCYGGLRFSEDLDFAGGLDFDFHQMVSIKSCIEEYLKKRYALEVQVIEPKDRLEELENTHIKVNKWQVRIITHPGRKDLPKQMVKIEIANVPAHTRTLRPLRHNYDFLPDGYSDTLVMVETLDEILADKLIAFVNCQPRIRNRDIWDLYWLKQQGAKIDFQLIAQKLNDYLIEKENYQNKVEELIHRLVEIIKPNSDFVGEIKRFLPMGLQMKTLEREHFFLLLRVEIAKYLQEVSDKLFCAKKLEKDGNIYFHVSGKLNEKNFERAHIIAGSSKDKNGFPDTYGMEATLIVVSTFDKSASEKIVQGIKDKYGKLSKGYKIDSELKANEWYIEFSPISSYSGYHKT